MTGSAQKVCSVILLHKNGESYINFRIFSVFFPFLLKLKQGVDERSSRGSTEDDQKAQKKKDDKDRYKPPFFVVPEEKPKLSNEACPFLLG